MYNNYLLGTCNCFTMVTNLNLIHQKMVTKGIFHFKREMLKLQRVLNNLSISLQTAGWESNPSRSVMDGIDGDLTPLHFQCPLDLQNASNGSKTLRKVTAQNCSMKVSFIVMWKCSALMFYKGKKRHLRCKFSDYFAFTKKMLFAYDYWD